MTAAHQSHDVGEEAILVRAVRDILRSDPQGVARALADLPLLGVFFLALVGTPHETAESKSPLVLGLRAIGETIDVWQEAPTTSKKFASVPLHELDRLRYRVAAAAEIARRTTPRKDGAS